MKWKFSRPASEQVRAFRVANVLEEPAAATAPKGQYQFGFHDPDESVFSARKGFDREIVEHISGLKDEPT